MNRPLPALAGFTSIRSIDKGGFGEVFRAVRASTGGDVALKFVPISAGEQSADLQRRLRLEISALVDLKGHANVVQVEDVIAVKDGFVIVMEYMPGGSLHALIHHRGGPLTPPEAVFVGRQIAQALVAAHSRGIVHRDIKPQNLLLGTFGQVKLCDFGIAAILRGELGSWKHDAFSPAFASPEELHAPGSVGPPSDMFSLGMTLQRLLSAPTSSPPRTDPNRTVRRWELTGIEIDVVRTIDRCRQPVPTSRPTARELLAELERIDAQYTDLRVDHLEPPVRSRPTEPAPSSGTSGLPRRVPNNVEWWRT